MVTETYIHTYALTQHTSTYLTYMHMQTFMYTYISLYPMKGKMEKNSGFDIHMLSSFLFKFVFDRDSTFTIDGDS